jgi:hypothetical protein
MTIKYGEEIPVEPSRFLAGTGSGQRG